LIRLYGQNLEDAPPITVELDGEATEQSSEDLMGAGLSVVEQLQQAYDQVVCVNEMVAALESTAPGSASAAGSHKKKVLPSDELKSHTSLYNAVVKLEEQGVTVHVTAKLEARGTRTPLDLWPFGPSA
jgi:hypothetical protein